MTTVNLSIPDANSSAIQAGDTPGTGISLDSTPMSIRSSTTASTKRHTGMRFSLSGSGLTQGSTINSATLTIYSAHSTVDDLRADVYGHDVDATDTFEQYTGLWEIYNLTKTTATTNKVEANCVLNAASTIDVTAIIQEIVDRAGWDEAAITLMLLGNSTNSDNYQLYGRTGTYPPNLNIDFTAASNDVTVVMDTATLTAAGQVLDQIPGTVTKTMATAALAANGINLSVALSGGAAVPTIALNTTDAHNFGADTTPTIEFTGTDTDTADELRYNIQIATENTFSTTPAITTQNIETDMGTVHANNVSGTGTEDDRPGNSFLGNGGFLDSIHLKMGIQGTPVGDYYVKIYEIQGTYGVDAEPLNAVAAASTPTPGYIAISDAWPVSTSTLSTSGVEKTVTFSGANRIRLEKDHAYYFIVNYVGTGDTSNAPFVSVSTAHTYAGDCYNDGRSTNNNGYVTAWEVWFKLYEQPLLLDKLSGTDNGFVNTVTGGDLDPFNNAEKVSFTVQAGEALPADTYYYRVRVKDPYGSNTYSAWSSIRSFIVDNTQTIAMATATITAAGQALTPAPGSITKTMATAALTANGIAATLVPGNTTRAMATATLTAIGQTATVTAPAIGNITLAMATASITATPRALTLVPGSVTKAMNTAALAAAGQTLDQIPGAVSISMNTALLTIAGQAITISAPPPGAINISMQTAQLQAIGRALDQIPGSVSILMDTAQLQATGIIGLPFSDAIPPTVVVMTTAVLTSNGQDLTIGAGAVSILMDTAILLMIPRGFGYPLEPHGTVVIGELPDRRIILTLPERLGLEP